MRSGLRSMGMEDWAVAGSALIEGPLVAGVGPGTWGRGG